MYQLFGDVLGFGLLGAYVSLFSSSLDFMTILFQIHKGGKFLWCCVGGSITR